MMQRVLLSQRHHRVSVSKHGHQLFSRQIRLSINNMSTSTLNHSTSLSGLISTDEVHYTLPSECYYEQEYFNIEKKLVMDRSWLLAGHMNVLLPNKGSIAEVNVAGESIVLVRKEGKKKPDTDTETETETSSDSIAAYFNVCPHRGHELVPPNTRSTLKSKALMCPNHGWSFHANTGQLVKARFSEDVVDFCASDFHLTTVPVHVMTGLVFVNLNLEHSNDKGDKDTSISPPPPPSVFGEDLTATLLKKIPGISSPHMQQLAVTEKVVNANWKILVDNFLECYHCDIAHKAFVDMVNLDDYSTAIRPHHVLFESSCNPENKAYCFSKDDPLQSAFFCWLWPYNVVYSAPGGKNLSILQFIPLTPTTTLRRSERFALVLPEEEGDRKEEESAEAKAAAARVDYLNKVLLQEDTGLCESVQRGLQSRAYQRGRLMVAGGGGGGGNRDQKWHTELAVAYFHKLLKAHTDCSSDEKNDSKDK